jgi:hypothetical protein
MSNEFIYSTTFRLKKGVEEDEKIKRILDNYDKDKYRSVNNLIKKAILELYAIERNAASVSKEDIAEMIKEAVKDALTNSDVIRMDMEETYIKPDAEPEQLSQKEISEEQVGDEVLSFLNSFDDLYDD